MKAIYIIIFLCFGMAGNAQKIYNMRTEQKENIYTIKYDITGAEGQRCSVRLFVSTDEGKTFEREITEASGDIGDNVELGRKKKIIWDATGENLDAEKVKFSLQITAIGMPPKKKKK